MKISIVTAAYNSASTIADTIESVLKQDYPNIELIIVDGASKDNTTEIVSRYKNPKIKFLSEPDKGIYDAMNKGIQLATGDIIGVLNSDDFFPRDNVISTIVKTFEKEKVDSIIGDITFVSAKDLNKVVRYYSSKKWSPDKFAKGYMPAHPSFYVKKKFYDQLGLYKTDYKICADYELLIRFLYVNKISYHYINKSMVTMRDGGVSNASLKSRYVLNQEIVRACRENNIDTNLFKVSLKVFSKLSELVMLKG